MVIMAYHKRLQQHEPPLDYTGSIKELLIQTLKAIKKHMAFVKLYSTTTFRRQRCAITKKKYPSAKPTGTFLCVENV